MGSDGGGHAGSGADASLRCGLAFSLLRETTHALHASPYQSGVTCQLSWQGHGWGAYCRGGISLPDSGLHDRVGPAPGLHAAQPFTKSRGRLEGVTSRKKVVVLPDVEDLPVVGLDVSSGVLGDLGDDVIR